MVKIAIASGKGGTGKTLLSTNLSVFLSKQMKVVLTDLDVEEPNCSVFVGGTLSSVSSAYKMIPHWQASTCIMCGKCSENCNFHAVIRLGPEIMVFKELCHSCFACSELCPTASLPMEKHQIGEISHIEDVNISFIEGKLNIGEEQAVPLIKQTQNFSQKFHYASGIEIIDCPPGSSCPVIAAIKNADFVILITEPTPFGLHDLKVAVETAKMLNKKIGIVINRDGIGNDDVENYCREFHIGILGKIKYDRRIASLYAQGEIVYTKIGHFNQALIDIMNVVMKELKHG